MNEQLAVQRKDVREFICSMKDQFALALPSLVTADRFVRVALTCINKQPKLLGCTRDSLLACLLDCAALGIEPDGRRAHLIPYGDKCTLILDYKGIAELIRRSGEISTLHCGIVYPSDDFDYAFGTGQFLKHKPSISRRNGEKPTCVYSYVKLKDGQEDFDVMSIEDVERVRSRGRAASSGPWVTDFDEMAKKTIFRRHSKWLPLSPELRDKIEKDDEPITEQERFSSAKPASVIEFDAPPPTQGTPDTSDTPKRHRRTKAEMEAATKPAAATPLEGLRNLMATSNIEENDLLDHLVEQLAIGEGEILSKMPDTKIQWIIKEWIDIAQGLKNAGQEVI